MHVDKHLYQINPRNGPQRLALGESGDPKDGKILVSDSEEEHDKDLDGGSERTIGGKIIRSAPERHAEEIHTRAGEYEDNNGPTRQTWIPINGREDLFDYIVPTVPPRKIRGELRLTRHSSAAPRLEQQVPVFLLSTIFLTRQICLTYTCTTRLLGSTWKAQAIERSCDRSPEHPGMEVQAYRHSAI